MKKLLTILSLLAVFTTSGAWAMSAQSEPTTYISDVDVKTYTIDNDIQVKHLKLDNGDRCYIVSSSRYYGRSHITCKFKE